MKDKLYLLPATFPDAAAGPGPFYCAACIQVEGLLACFPQLREVLDIEYVDFPRPRPALVELLGEAHQGCPLLVAAAPGPGLQQVNGQHLAPDVPAIAAYLAARYGIPLPHP